MVWLEMSAYFLVVLTLNVNAIRWTLPGQSCELVYDEPCTSKTDIIFTLTSSQNQNLSLVLDPFSPQIPLSLNLSVPTKVLIHGYGGIGIGNIPEIAKVYTAAMDVNVITVDWSTLASMPCYPQALINTWQVGRCTSILLTSLTALGVQPHSIHPIGFSLGAHVAGIIGQLYIQTFKTKLARITGLDPALPLYATLSFKKEWILDADDAYFVDIIHTNAGVYGKLANTGDVDFYLNGGTNQPHCANSSMERLCSHLMSPEYFRESITSKPGFWGVPCSSYFSYLFGECPLAKMAKIWKAKPVKDASQNRVLMGEHCSKTSRGVYFVRTAADPPYALG